MPTIPQPIQAALQALPNIGAGELGGLVAHTIARAVLIPVYGF